MVDHVLIRGKCVFKHLNWAERFIFNYSKYNGKSFSFPYGEMLQAVDNDGTVTLRVDGKLKESAPGVFEHALFVGEMLDCEIDVIEHR